MRIFILTGAGVSKESGIDTFRDAGGVWTRYRLEDVATPEGFARGPDLVHEFYNMRRKALADVAPNAAHYALARLAVAAAESGGDVFLCTQNVDDLHERGGAPQVHHMHGELCKAFCAGCGAVRAWAADEALSTALACQVCGQAGGMRPAVVWFGEMPWGMDRLYDALAASDLFVSIGTSGAVYPAAGFVMDARARGLATLELNLEPSENAAIFTEGRYGPATEIVPAWVDEIIAQRFR